MKRKKILKLFMVFTLISLCLFSFLFGVATPLIANAVTITGYSSVLGDLKIDDNFNSENYPSNKKDYSLQVIQIAESTGGELFIYTYQPSALKKQFELTTITISQYVENNAVFKLYDLKLLDSDGVFAKYKVNGIQLKTDMVRFYEITEIHRKFDLDFGDEQPDNGNTTTEVACGISQRWSATTFNGEVYYNLVTFDTIKVEAKRVGFVRYKNSTAPSWIDKDSVDSHYVAFSIGEYDFDDLVEAEVYFDSQLVKTYSDPLVKNKYSDPVSNYVSLKAETKVTINENHTIAWNTNMYEYNEIQTVNEFFSSVNRDLIYEHGIFYSGTATKLSSEVEKEIKGMQYVLRFANTDYSEVHSTAGAYVSNETFTTIENVTILSLTFMKDGDTIKIGVIDNKTNGTGIPDTVNKFLLGFSDLFVDIMKAIGIIFAFIVLGILVSLIVAFKEPIAEFFKTIWGFIVKIFSIIWWVISSPFELFKTSKKKKSKKRKKKN